MRRTHANTQTHIHTAGKCGRAACAKNVRFSNKFQSSELNECEYFYKEKSTSQLLHIYRTIRVTLRAYREFTNKQQKPILNAHLDIHMCYCMCVCVCVCVSVIVYSLIELTRIHHTCGTGCVLSIVFDEAASTTTEPSAVIR